MSGEDESIGQLDRSEWDFSNIPADEIHHCFFYEYARSCPAAVEMIKYIQQNPLLKGKFTWETAADDSDEKGAEILKHQHLKLFRFLADMRCFPDLPWRKAFDTEVEEKNERYLKLSGQKDFSAAFQSQHLESIRRSILSAFQPNQLSLIEPKLIDINSLRQKSPNTYENPLRFSFSSPNETLSFLLINWGNTDSDLKKAFGKLLKENRPDEFPEPKHKLKQQAIHGEDLPFKKDSALGWLGVWRRKKKLEDWMDFIKIYSISCRGENGTFNAKRTLEEQFSKAVVILESFDKRGKVEQTSDGRRLIFVPEGNGF